MMYILETLKRIGMATIKSCTDIPQSKKLAEFLPLETADMCYVNDGTAIKIDANSYNVRKSMWKGVQLIPCWSLAALLDILDYPQLSKDKLGSGKVGWMVSVYPNDCRYDSCWNDNPVDVCVAMIEKLNELKML